MKARIIAKAGINRLNQALLRVLLTRLNHHIEHIMSVNDVITSPNQSHRLNRYAPCCLALAQACNCKNMITPVVTVI